MAKAMSGHGRHATSGVHVLRARHACHAACSHRASSLSRGLAPGIAALAGLLAAAACSVSLLAVNAPRVIASEQRPDSPSVSVSAFTPQALAPQSAVSVAASRSAVRTSPLSKWSTSTGLDRFDASQVSVFSLGPLAYGTPTKTYLGLSPLSPKGMSAPGYPFSQCTWWAAIRRAQLGRPVTSTMGNGADWAATARRLGWKVDHVPEVGAVISFHRGQLGASATYGHVAVVEQILPDGSIITSECGAPMNGKPYMSRITGATALDFIH